jgi:hypothetical protein
VLLKQRALLDIGASDMHRERCLRGRQPVRERRRCCEEQFGKGFV